jgi:L-threonylcarbamoyladenylate synthase
LSEVTVDIPEKAQVLADIFWPGPMTLVLKKASHIPDIVTAGKDTVAVRVPAHPVALEILGKLEFPLAAPSANPFGSISPTCALHVHDYFGDRLKVILDGGDCQKGIESTIIGFEDGVPIIYRLGSLSIDQIEHKIGPIKTKMYNDNTAPEAPGMLSRHYAPSTETILTDEDKQMGLLLFEDYNNNVAKENQEILSKNGDVIEAAKNLYAAMHRLDRLNLDIIIAQRFPNIGLGMTLNDKLQRASNTDNS